MSPIFENNACTIGNTPLVRINRLVSQNQAAILAKIEGRNPGYSVKCRVGVMLIEDAERRGLINSDTTIIEPTSGNTGIALAFTCAVRGYKLILTMPESMSVERRKMLASFGAEIILTESSKGMSGAIRKADEMVQSNPKKFYMPQQFKNQANVQAHVTTTGPEIDRDTNGKIDILVAGVGTGGTLTGVSHYFKILKQQPIISVAVEPSNSPVLSQIRAGLPIKHSPHLIQGIGAGFKPDILNMDLIDMIETVSDDEAIEMAKRLPKEEGITCGISSGAAMSAAVRLSKKQENINKTIVVILPDSGERYLSTSLFI